MKFKIGSITNDIFNSYYINGLDDTCYFYFGLDIDSTCEEFIDRFSKFNNDELVTEIFCDL